MISGDMPEPVSVTLTQDTLVEGVETVALQLQGATCPVAIDVANDDGTFTGISPKRAEVLAEHGVRVFRDLLYYFPRRYLDRSTVTPISKLDERMGAVTVVGRVRTKGIVPVGA